MFKIKHLLIVVILMPFILFSEDSRGKELEQPLRAITSKYFEVRHLNFNKIFDPHGRGYVLQVEFEIVNLTDIKLDLYIFTIATFEELSPSKDSFDRPGEILPEVRNFTPYPDDLKNFEYSQDDNKGGKKYTKFPRDPKLGVNPGTGKAYVLGENLIVGTSHLSKFRKNYEFFNVATILIFDASELTDKQGNLTPAYRQIYQIKGIRK